MAPHDFGVRAILSFSRLFYSMRFVECSVSFQCCPKKIPTKTITNQQQQHNTNVKDSKICQKTRKATNENHVKATHNTQICQWKFEIDYIDMV